jgi:hypothetical protein
MQNQVVFLYGSYSTSPLSWNLNLDGSNIQSRIAKMQKRGWTHLGDRLFQPEDPTDSFAETRGGVAAVAPRGVVGWRPGAPQRYTMLPVEPSSLIFKTWDRQMCVA